MSKWYIYDFETKLGDKYIRCFAGTPQNKLIDIFMKFTDLLRLCFIGVAFYINSNFIHSFFFDLFIFAIAIWLIFFMKNTDEYSLSKEEFINKINEITTD